MGLVGQAALLVSFPVGAAVIGSLTAIWRRPGPKLMSGVQHFAAGVVMAALVGEVLPELRAEGRLAWAVAGFTIGVVTVLSLGAWSRSLEARGRPTARASGYLLPVGLLTAVGIDLLLDGLLVGLGVTLGAAAGLILTIALTIEILFLSLSVAGELIETGMPKSRSALICIALGLATAIGAIGGAALLGDASPELLAAVLAFGSAALLYLDDRSRRAPRQHPSLALGPFGPPDSSDMSAPHR